MLFLQNFEKMLGKVNKHTDIPENNSTTVDQMHTL